MTAAAQELADLLREVQKLQKELQPVRSAIAALQKREAETPNPAAAGTSLHKVASRLETVKLKYEPFLARLQELLSDEVPALLQQTQLLAMRDECFDGKPTAAAQEASVAARSSNRNGAGGTNPASAAHHAREDDAARLLREVCPPCTPHLLQPENLRFTQQQLRIRAEMVDYLIATDRLAIADHVARAYGLPLQWFPRLVALHRKRAYGGAASAAAAPGVAGGRSTGAHSPTGSARTTAPSPTPSPLVTPAMRPRGGGSAGMPPKSPIQLPPSTVPARVSSTGSTIDHLRSPAGSSNTAAAVESFTALPPPVRSLQRDGQSPSVGPSYLRGNAGGTADGAAAASNATPGTVPAAAPSATTTSCPSPNTLMPDLVARVVSAAMYLKDDYVDRMVLERTLEQSLGLVSQPPSSPSSTPAVGGAAPTPAEQYKACVLSRMSRIPRHHLHTQSGDAVFDSAIMNVIEDLLVYGLQRWAEDDTSMPDTTIDAQRGAETAEALAAETTRRKAELLRSLTTDTFLTAEEMLLADKVWNEDILFLKRPTRFYCVETGLSTDEAAATDGATPRARATGEVISQFVAEAQGLLDTTTGIFIT
jgi:hypothetical protein